MRIRPVLLVASLATLAAAPAAQAQGYYRPPPRYGPPESGLYLGGKFGFGFPNGDLSGDVGAMSDTVTMKIPLGVEFGLRVNRLLRVGLYGEFAPSGVKDAVCGQSSCSGSDTRLGVDVQLHFGTFTPVDPWIGLGFGYEWLSNNGVAVNVNGVPAVVDETWSGWQFPVLEGGVDFPITPQFTVGPYLGLEFGSFDNYSATGFGSSSIANTARHGWITIGVKGTFLL